VTFRIILNVTVPSRSPFCPAPFSPGGCLRRAPCGGRGWTDGAEAVPLRYNRSIASLVVRKSLECAMKHVNLNAQEESVKRFVLGLAADAGGSVLELNGQVVACVVPAPKPVRSEAASETWTEQKNARRSELIDKEIDDVLTPDEAVELRQLQEEMLRYQNKVAPWPIQTARQLHQELLGKAAKAQDGPDA
jgi:hypothetical protein